MKKKYHEKEQQNSHRQPPTSKGQGLAKRRGHSTNKENLIQITEPLDVNPQTYPSKEFILSRESLSHSGKPALKDIGGSRNHTRQQNTVQVGGYQPQKSQEWFDRRLSLKCTGNYSQQLDYQKSQRLSMAPLRRQSLGQVTAPQSLMDERESMSSVYQNSLFSSDSKSKTTIKKQVIITNLMHKLDHEQDLRSIIESKLKTGANTSSISYQKRNQSYVTDYTEQPGNSMGSKLRQCQNEIVYFKTVIREMSEKILQMSQEKKFQKKKKNSHTETDMKQTTSREDLDVLSLLKRISSNCQCQQKIVKSIGIQVEPTKIQSRPVVNQSYDFLDNLEATLKVLDGRS